MVPSSVVRWCVGAQSTAASRVASHGARPGVNPGALEARYRRSVRDVLQLRRVLLEERRAEDALEARTARAQKLRSQRRRQRPGIPEREQRALALEARLRLSGDETLLQVELQDAARR